MPKRSIEEVWKGDEGPMYGPTSDTKQAATCPSCGGTRDNRLGCDQCGQDCLDSFHSAHPVSAGQGYDRFARCPECGHATVGLSPPFYINHASECSRPRGVPWPDPPSGVERLADELAAAEARAAEAESALEDRGVWSFDTLLYVADRLLAEYYPESIFPDVAPDEEGGGDPGPQLVRAVRRARFALTPKHPQDEDA